MTLLFQIPSHVQAHLPANDVVALESTVITHGLPYPQNEEIAIALENEVLQEGCQPATVGMIAGQIIVGLDSDQLHQLATGKAARKISQRDFGIAIANRLDGGTTVAGTIIAAHHAGIHVFATGGIGGVHRGSIFDVSADLEILSKYPMIVVCAGAKSILDLPATLERLETLGVPVLGYQTDEFPAFYSTTSGLGVDKRVDSPEEVVRIAKRHWELGIQSSLLVVVPPPAESALPYDEVETHIQAAVHEAEQQHIHGARLTPFLLEKMNHLTSGKSMRANLALLKNNARVAAMIAKVFSQVV
ncbi:MAG TPA: pseudouridine-5-phosphate glycosidase [Anaerolineaceae bacterium]|uniref:Pseudouridine-5'-phosphate glycosidase n=1 Tax=Anaerolinea thermophila TaxID=167964 RepID=A0A117LGX6_9CHLR|nr:MAG: Pseudouridine-5'-phosphate glycosidase [Anaerolinea thermophila]HAF62100.1 pseudouridine-5-phosphate glycosidase [Anaerolineaceae bacterium]